MLQISCSWRMRIHNRRHPDITDGKFRCRLQSRAKGSACERRGLICLTASDIYIHGSDRLTSWCSLRPSCATARPRLWPFLMWLASRVTKALGYSTRYGQGFLALIGMSVGDTRFCVGARRSGPNIVFLHVGSLDVQVVSRASESVKGAPQMRGCTTMQTLHLAHKIVIRARGCEGLGAFESVPQWRGT